MPKSVVCSMLLLALVLAACSKPTEEKITEFTNNRYKIDIRSREFHNSGIRNVDVCVDEASSKVFPADKGQCFLRGFDFSNLAVNWRSDRDIEISFDCGRITSFTNFAVISKGQTVPVEFHASLHDACKTTAGRTPASDGQRWERTKKE